MADEDEDTSGDSIDAFSEKFDAFKALYSDKVRVPVPDAPVFDNISKFESIILHGLVIKETDKEKQQEKEAKDTPSSSSARRFLPHQEPIKSVSSQRPQKYLEKNILSRMQKAFGPLAMLYQYMENKTRVKVYTRNASGLRGHVEAYVAAFDRHWNLALEDCLELWSRKVKRKAPALGCPSDEVKCRTDGIPKIIVKKRNGKLETLERHVPQLLIRGEQVALIVKID